MAITASDLRRDVYRLLDEALETGVAIEIERRGRRLRIVPEARQHPLDAIVPRPDLTGDDLDDLDEFQWSDLWDPDENIDPS